MNWTPQAEKLRQELIRMMNEMAVIRGEITLTSGLKSNFYIDGKQVTLHPRGAYIVSRLMWEALKGKNVQAVGGLTMGADPMVSALSYLIGELSGSDAEAAHMTTFLVRKEPKKHGMRREIEGPFTDGQTVAIVDDVITTGGSVMKAVDAVREYGCNVPLVIVLLDRMQGSQETLKDFQLISLVRLDELDL